MGKVVAEMCTVAKTSISAELLRTITVIHHFATHMLPVRSIRPCTSVERSEERLNYCDPRTGVACCTPSSLRIRHFFDTLIAKAL